MKIRNEIIKTFIAVIATMAVCVLLLTLTSLIPRNMIQKNSEVSAEYFLDRIPFPVLIGDYVNSIQDNFSDTVLCDIIYSIDTRHPFKSAISAKYVLGEYENANTAYYRAVFENAPVNTEYSRYWHGSMVLLRPLLIVMPINAIRWLYGGLCILIQFIIAAILFRSGKKSLAVCSILSLILIEPHMLFVSLEHSNIFLVASAAELFVLLWIRGRIKHEHAIGNAGSSVNIKNSSRSVGSSSDKIFSNVIPWFGVIGVVTFFTDFLTTETLTFTLPMLIVMAYYADGKQTVNIKDGFLLVVKSGIAWFFGYASMFVLKIGMIFVVSGKEVMKSSFEEGLFRMGGDVRIANFSTADTVDTFAKLGGAIWHNLACLYPVKTGEIRAASAYVPTLIILLVGVAIVYLLHEKIDWALFIPVGVIAIIPFLRFLVLSNHAYLHFFFTYRALMVTIAVFLYFVYENGIRYLGRRK